MEITVSGNTSYSEKILLKKGLLICGILSSIFYAAMNVFVPVLWDGFDSVSQTVSELSAVGAPTKTLWVCLGYVYTLLVLAFGVGAWLSAGRNRPLRIVAGLILAYGFVSFFWPFAPMHQRTALARGEGTITDTMHLVLTAVSVLIMTIAIGFGTRAFGRGFRIYSIVTMITLLAFGALTAIDAPKVQSNLPTPLLGIWERVNIGIFLLWIIVLAAVLLRAEKENGST
jgi:hypothetical protein